ncbi:toxic anion resistance protein [Metasolibacillus meyeri]|uniref:Toxic anion resistance protein n=1 Tax=Metasolibacillus meyeri TaxID=1071052 RepID=A0AAW9NYR3_9BACL|nr:toxic anion resistance protein [Metasolibacillus meyeri]MEC1180220.1 toxic anion resistance protein [Metasolibacillus meyeri]
MSFTLEKLTQETADSTKEQLRQSAEVQQIAREINIKNQLDIMEFGKEPAIKLTNFSDRMLRLLANAKVNESGELLRQLEALMDKFDKKEIVEEKGFFKRLFKRAPKQQEDLWEKYSYLTRDIEKMHYQFVLMEETLASDNRVLAGLYREDLQYYLELEKYILAVELKLNEVATGIARLEQQSVDGNQIAKMELQTYQTVAQLLEQKRDDLEKSRIVAILAAPQIEMLQEGNRTLMQQINEAFIKTIPVFKIGIINAVNDKKRQLQNDSAKAFENRMKQVGGINADAVQLSTAMVNQQDGTQTLEEIWDHIVEGITSYRQLRDEQSQQRQKAEQQLKALQVRA